MSERLYYVEKHDETLQTSDRLEAINIAAEWVRRGYAVELAVIEVSDDTVTQADMRAAA